MKLVFLSNYFNHHQKEISKHFSELCSSYTFLATSKMREERKKLGYGEESYPDYVVDLSNSNAENVETYIDKNDIIIYGSARIKKKFPLIYNDKIVFRYSERPLKNGDSIIKYIPRMILFRIQPILSKKVYLLCASAYTTWDYGKFFMYKNRTYKWGYFPETKYYDIDSLIRKKRKNRILWCGRFLDWKHPEDVIKVAKRLKEKEYIFEIIFVGTGEQENLLKQKVVDLELQEQVFFKGSMKPHQVRKEMENAGIFLFTSDKKEGWGAVLNESMNSGCAVIASHAIGSVPYLMKHNNNGLIYASGNVDELYEKVKFILDYPSEQERLGKEAYKTITNLWNAEVAAERFVTLTERIRNGEEYPDLYEDGPCSKAEIIKDDWIYE